MRRALLLLAGCWTGSPAKEPPPPATASEPPSAFEVTMKRTACLGTCPVYEVAIDGDGRVRWRGVEHVEAVGERRATVPPRRIAEIRRMLDAVEFFRRDERGELSDPQPQCVRTATSTSCSFSRSITICSDTSSAIVTVRRGQRKHAIANDHCDPSPLDELEALIDDVARTTAWIGERVLTH